MSQQQYYETVQRQEEWEDMQKLASALVKAQAEMTGAKKDSANPFFKSKYADLGSVMEAIRPALSAHGLGFVQVCHDADNQAIVETVIIHESGETYSCGKTSVPVTKVDAQGYGSAITYARRYSLQTAFGVPSVDDDGNAAAAAKPEKVTKAPKLRSPPLQTENWTLTQDRVEVIFAAAKQAVAQHVAGDNSAAFDEVSGITDTEEKQYLWGVITEYSALRAALKAKAALARAAE